MADSLWYMDVEDRIFSLIKAKTFKTLKAKYPTIKYTTVNHLDTDSTFSHVVYIHELAGIENGRDMENKGINAYLSTFDIIVSVTEESSDSDGLDKKEEVREIVGVIIEAFKSLGFNVIAMPTLQITDGAYSIPIRVRREIGANDIDLLGNASGN